MTGRAQIDDAEPIVADSKAGGRVNDSSNIVWPAMGHRGHHPIKRLLIQSSSRVYQPTAYRTHLVNQPFKSRCVTPIGGRMTRPLDPLNTSFKPLLTHRK